MPNDTQAEKKFASQQRHSPDPHGQAALLLAESTLHGLLEKGLLTNDEAIAITTAAMEVKEEVIDEETEPMATGWKSLRLIEKIASSLEIDTGSDGVSMSGPS